MLESTAIEGENKERRFSLKHPSSLNATSWRKETRGASCLDRNDLSPATRELTPFQENHNFNGRRGIQRMRHVFRRKEEKERAGAESLRVERGKTNGRGPPKLRAGVTGGVTLNGHREV